MNLPRIVARRRGNLGRALGTVDGGSRPGSATIRRRGTPTIFPSNLDEVRYTLALDAVGCLSQYGYGYPSGTAALSNLACLRSDLHLSLAWARNLLVNYLIIVTHNWPKPPWRFALLLMEGGGAPDMPSLYSRGYI